MTFKTFAVAGAGNIGVFLAEELLKQKAAGNAEEVLVLGRLGSKNGALAKLEKDGAKVVLVDFADTAKVAAALAGTDVVLSAITFSAIAEAQVPLAEAAKQAGVKLFVPSEFGEKTDALEGGVLLPKKLFQDKLRALGLPFALVYNGPFPDFVLTPFIGVDFEHGKAAAGGDGSNPVSWTARRDVGAYVAYVLTHLPAERLNWRIFRIEGDRQSFNDVFAAYEARTGKKLQITYRSVEELEAALKANPYDFGTVLQLGWARGEGIVGEKGELTNAEFPGWKPKKAIDAILGN